MIFHLPFVYEAIIKKAPKGKEVYVVVEDSIELNVETFNHMNCRPAIQVGEDALLWNGKELLKPFNARISGELEISITATDILMNISSESMANPDKSATAIFPFSGYFDYEVPNMDNTKRLKATKNASVNGLSFQKTDTPHHEWICDSREYAIAKLKQIAANLALVDDVIYTKTTEPVYNVRYSCEGELPAYCIVTATFDHSLAMPNTVLFNANSYDEAMTYSAEHAQRLGIKATTKRLLGIQTNPAVLINDAIKMPIKTIREV
jgi:hypothetical protein